MQGKLTESRVRLLAPGAYTDLHGLRLKVQRSGTKQWSWRGTVGPRRVEYGLGSWPYLKLEDARELAFEYRRAARRGEDPYKGRRNATMPTFEELAEQFLQVKRRDWTGRSAAQMEKNARARLGRYINPMLGGKRVDAITSGDIQAMLEQSGLLGTTNAGQCRSLVRGAMARAVVLNYRADNPAEQAKVVKPNGRRSQPAVPHARVADVLDALRASNRQPGAALALAFQALTATRPNEAFGAEWAEVDLAAAVWAIPLARLKNRGKQRTEPHHVPLSAQALALLRQARALGEVGGRVFSTARGGPLYSSAMGDAMQGALARACPDYSGAGQLAALRQAWPEYDEDRLPVPHGFRSSFRDWAGETGEPGELAEAALGHARAAVEGAYYRSNLLDQRRPLMQAWADYVAPGA